MTETRPPTVLRNRVASSLEPVRPLPPPGRRALLFLAIGVALLAGVSLAWGIRENAHALGPWLWALSGLQVAAASLLFRRALAESIPGRLTARSRVLLWATLGLALTCGVTAITFIASPTYVPGRWGRQYFYICSTRTFALGLLPLAIAALLLRRGLTARPMLAGALAGLGSGLLADASWRIYCEVSDPTHVLAAHTGGLLALCALGALGGSLLRLAGGRPQRP